MCSPTNATETPQHAAATRERRDGLPCLDGAMMLRNDATTSSLDFDVHSLRSVFRCPMPTCVLSPDAWSLQACGAPPDSARKNDSDDGLLPPVESFVARSPAKEARMFPVLLVGMLVPTR